MKFTIFNINFLILTNLFFFGNSLPRSLSRQDSLDYEVYRPSQRTESFDNVLNSIVARFLSDVSKIANSSSSREDLEDHVRKFMNDSDELGRLRNSFESGADAQALYRQFKGQFVKKFGDVKITFQRLKNYSNVVKAMNQFFVLLHTASDVDLEICIPKTSILNKLDRSKDIDSIFSETLQYLKLGEVDHKDLNLAWSSKCEQESNQRNAILSENVELGTESPVSPKKEKIPSRALADERDELSISCFACRLKMKGKNIGKGFKNFGKGFAEVCQGLVNVATLCVRPH